MASEPFSAVLRQARERRGLSQRALAQKAGVTDSYVSQLESGRRPPPRPRVITALARALGVEGAALQEAADLERMPQRLRRRLTEAQGARAGGRRLRDRLLGSTIFHWVRGSLAADPLGALTDLPREHRLLLGRVLSRARQAAESGPTLPEPERILAETTAAEREVIAEVLPGALARPAPPAPTRALEVRARPLEADAALERVWFDAALAPPGAFFWRMPSDQAHPRVERGDLLLVCPHEPCAPGDLVVVAVGEDFEVRRFEPRGGEARLHAMRPDQPPLRRPLEGLHALAVRAILRPLPPAGSPRG